MVCVGTIDAFVSSAALFCALQQAGASSSQIQLGRRVLQGWSKSESFSNNRLIGVLSAGVLMASAFQDFPSCGHVGPRPPGPSDGPYYF
eukprot:3031851-Amphidinium_carterae.2